MHAIEQQQHTGDGVGVGGIVHGFRLEHLGWTAGRFRNFRNGDSVMSLRGS